MRIRPTSRAQDFITFATLGLCSSYLVAIVLGFVP